MGIVATAEASVERSKTQLRQLVERIQDFLDWQTAADVDLAAELDLDMRTDFEPPATKDEVDTATAVDEPDDAEPAGERTSVSPALGAVEVSSNGSDELREGDAVADSEAMESYFTDEDQPAPAADDAQASDERVANAVRRAVQGWSSSRRGGESD